MPKIVDHEAMRRHILTQCFHFFAYKGYRGVSMRALASGLGISTGTLYHYFTKKADLFSQMLQRLTEDDIAQVVEHIGDSQEAMIRLERFLEFMESRQEYFRKLIYLFIDLHRHENKGEEDTDEELMHASRMLKNILTLYVSAIEANLGQPFDKMGHFVMNFIVGKLIFSLAGPNEESTNQLRQLLEQMACASPLA